MSDYDALVVGGGQSGLAAAHHLRTRGLNPAILEAGDEPVGSWPHYYDSLTLFSPAKYSALPGLPFPGDPDRYPRRDEVVDYLRRYAKTLDTDIHVNHRVLTVDHDGGTFTAHTDTGTAFTAPRLIAATGGFGSPHLPDLPGRGTFTGKLVHASDYRTPDDYARQNVIVVGSGNSAVQIAAELADVADEVVLAVRSPVKFVPQRPLGRDMHFWFTVTGLGAAPIGHLLKSPPTVPVFDTGRYRAGLAAGKPGVRPMFTALDGGEAIWADGTRSRVDAVLLATGYTPHLPYLAGLGALTDTGRPRHRRGLSTTHRGLGYLGLEWQRSLSSASLRGVGRDAHHLVARLSRKTGR
ncbi:flavin-containing monooxygenase [Rhodococcus opacus]|uniref:FAD-dependent oxidoreductase n=1 Tax=Rhodococcus opacus TaxID=37919 RepID=A0A076F6F8_RHOOP|nr:NAD(P)-binding domain-containing protein [Rhodococcus opacus]AII11264.1 FAD-dependent oxidoreductase [Rhodococcus opacus]